MALKLLILHPDDSFRKHLSERMRLENYRVAESYPAAETMEILQACRFDVILLKVSGPTPERLAALGKIKGLCPDTEVILLTSQEEHTLQGSIQAMRMGAFDELIVPLDIGVLHRRIRDAHERRKDRAGTKRFQTREKDPGKDLHSFSSKKIQHEK